MRQRAAREETSCAVFETKMQKKGWLSAMKKKQQKKGRSRERKKQRMQSEERHLFFSKKKGGGEGEKNSLPHTAAQTDCEESRSVYELQKN